jgi:uncharacterized protein Yka (UPF0111/DUF47 family)
LPARIGEALTANDFAKYAFALIQSARTRADAPDGPVGDLRTERLAAGVGDGGLDSFVAAAVPLGADRYRMPGVNAVLDRLAAALGQMVEPLEAAGDERAAEFRSRLQALLSRDWRADDDVVTAARIDALVSGERRPERDTAHLLVMDLHKALNGLQKRIAQEQIDGASCYDIGAADRALIAAFMRGVNRTRSLKFGHPGLGTTATRVGARLVLQNDIGTTDAHVLVVHVEARTVSVTYTDVHLQRLLFFQRLFREWEVAWDDTRSRSDGSTEAGIYHLCVGRYAARDVAHLRQFMEFLGSRLVFLIDWNRARKRLRLLLPKKETMALLEWAAEQDVGHMGFLAADASQEIYNALGYLTRDPISPDTGLADLLGCDRALEFMKFVLRVCAEELLLGRATDLIHDEIRAELVTYFRSLQQSLLDVAVEHAAYSVELASGTRDSLLRAGEETVAEEFALNAKRAKRWERAADDLLNRARNMVRRGDRAEFYLELIQSADDIADDLEDAAFHLTLLKPKGSGQSLFKPLTALAEALVAGTQEYVKALETSRSIKRGGLREDMQDFLEAIHRIVAMEQVSDEAQRAVKRALSESDVDCRQLYAFAECARTLEAAADSLMHTGLSLRDYVLAEVLAE